MGSFRALTAAFLLLSTAHAEGDAEKGKELYLKSCAQCHGEAGDGKGPAAERLIPRPRDFTTGAYKIRMTPSGEIPTDEDLARAISLGLPGTAMPPWKDAYNKAQIDDLVAYIKTFSERFKTEKPSKVYSLSGVKKATPDSLANGRKIYMEMQCFSCHGMEGRADGLSAVGMTDDSGTAIRPANFHKGWNLRGGHQVSDIFRTFMTGLNGTPMPAYIDALGDNPEGIAKAWDLANYVHSLSPDQPETGEVVRSRPVQGPLPDDPMGADWHKAKPTGFLLLGQIVEEPREFNPSVDYIKVRSLYNDKEVAFLLEWDDPFRDPNPETKSPPDQIQVQIPMAPFDAQSGEKPYFLEGDPSHPVSLWTWNAKADKVAAGKATGLKAAKAALPTVFVSSSSFADGQWRLVIKRPLRIAKEEGLSLVPGQFVPLAFSAWDGANGEQAAKRSVSNWYYLFLEPEKPKSAYAYPILAFIVVGGLEFLFLKRRRGRDPSGPAQPPNRGRTL